ncbi:hypothetical protein BGZ76_009919 [Entomortierella beljakovae]|nr:hypothetical protein BGZ76_009919 [Entomortierella beljakovae]
MTSNSSAPTSSLSVIIVGAGLGGLMLGILFEQIGIPYHIFERASEVRPLGSAMSLTGDFFPIFEQLGLLNELEAMSLPFSSLDIFDANRKQMGSIDLASRKPMTGHYTRIFARPDLHRLLLKRIPEGKISYRKKVLRIDEKENKVSIHCSDDTTFEGDILIGADGAYSGVRQSLYKWLDKEGILPKSDQENLSIGYVSMVGIADPPNPEKYPQLQREFAHFSQSLGADSTSWGVYSVPGNRICWLLNTQLDSSSGKDEQSGNSEWGPEANAAMLKKFEDKLCPWGGLMGEIFDATPKDLISKVYLEEKLFETWYHSRTVLIGDACHKMLPGGGAGAVNAMQDAVVLANCFYNMPDKTSESITAAFEDYKRQRYGRAEMHIERSKNQSKIMGGQASWSKGDTFNSGNNLKITPYLIPPHTNIMNSTKERVIRYILLNFLPNWVQQMSFARVLEYRPQIAWLPLAEICGTGRFIDRKNARHFHLVHRSQRDPLSRDDTAPQRVLREVIPANLVGKVKIPEDYDDDPFEDEEEGSDEDVQGDGINYGTYDRSIEDVELLETTSASKKKKPVKDESKIGEAALMGLMGAEFNDGYDYTQHMKEIGRSSDAVFVAAPKTVAQEKKAAQSRGIQFTDSSAAQEMAKDDAGKSTASRKSKKLNLPSEVLPSKEELDFSDVYQSAVPIGLQPDMPFDIRQTLEALEDEAFVDGELDEAFFDDLDGEGGDFEFEDEDDYSDEEEEEESATGWEADFKKFKKERKYASDDDSYEGSDDGHSQVSKSSRRPGGASASTFSMSSSAMFRNENLTLLDERFDKIEREYEDDSLDEDEAHDLNAEEMRKDFDSILDDFLDKYEIVGSKMVPKLEGVSSSNKLSTIRNALLVDEGEDEKSVATTVGGTRRPRKAHGEDLATELQTDFRSRAEKLRDSWDVQTILSTYSNLDNHPGLIKERHQRRIHIDPKTGMPIVTEVLSKKALQRRKEIEEAEAAAAIGGNSDDEFSDEEEEFEEAENLGVKRNKEETKEEKKARKEAIKAEKRNRRETKKATKTAFASEKSRQEKVMKNLKKGQGVMHLD